MADKTKIIRTLTCFTAAASLVLATVPAYGAENPSPAAPQSPTATKDANSGSVDTPDRSQGPNSTADEGADNNGNDGLEIQESGPESSTPQAAGSPQQIPYAGGTVLSGASGSSGKPLTNRAYPALSMSKAQKIGQGWRTDGVLMLGDMTGNRRADLLYFTKRDDDVFIRLYEGYGIGKVVDRGEIGHGWGHFDTVAAGDMNRDGLADMIGRDNQGNLYLYQGLGNKKRFAAGKKIGYGWGDMRSLTVLPKSYGNLPTIVAIDNAGQMHLYPYSVGLGGFMKRISLGYGWKPFTRIMNAGDWDRNGRSDFIATDSAGYMYMYLSAPSAEGFSSYRLGQGWNGMSQILPIDASLTGGGIMAIDHSGQLFYYSMHVRPRHTAGARKSRYLMPVNSITRVRGTVTPRRGWNGTKVRQVRLAVGVGAPQNSSMTFDGSTEAAVKRVQKRHHLTASGVVYRSTWTKLTGRSWYMDNFQMRPAFSSSASRARRINAMINFAKSQTGSAYTWGGAGGYRDGYDCSGLALQALYVAGIDPQPINVLAHAAPTYRSSKQLYAHPKLRKVSFRSRQPGDLVFWGGRDGVYHVAIYIGGNQIVESNYGGARQRGLYNYGAIMPYVVRP